MNRNIPSHYSTFTKLKTFTLKPFNNTKTISFPLQTNKYTDPSFQHHFTGPILQKDYYINKILSRTFQKSSPSKRTKLISNKQRNVHSKHPIIPKAVIFNSKCISLEKQRPRKGGVRNCFNELITQKEIFLSESNPLFEKYGDHYLTTTYQSYYLTTKGSDANYTNTNSTFDTNRDKGILTNRILKMHVNGIIDNNGGNSGNERKKVVISSNKRKGGNNEDGLNVSQSYQTILPVIRHK